MAGWMNRYDIEDARERYDAPEFHNLHEGATILWRLMVWTDNNSDGWPYWAKPGRAAKQLQDLLSEGLHKYDAEDCSEADLNKALRPIKAFLTRQGVDQELVFTRPVKS